MADRETLENSLESTVCPIERRRLINRLAQRKHRLKLKEQRVNVGAENHEKGGDGNPCSMESNRSPPTPQQMSTQRDKNMTRNQQPESTSPGPRRDTMPAIEKMMRKQRHLTSGSAESSTTFEWTSPFESGYALLNGHA